MALQEFPWITIDLRRNYTVKQVTIYVLRTKLYKAQDSFIIQVGNTKPTLAKGVPAR